MQLADGENWQATIGVGGKNTREDATGGEVSDQRRLQQRRPPALSSSETPSSVALSLQPRLYAPVLSRRMVASSH